MTLSLTVQYASKSKTLPSRAQVRRWALAGHRARADKRADERAGESVVTIRYVDEAEARALNRNFRGKDYATNVLTFVHEPAPSPLRGGPGRGSARNALGSSRKHPHPNPLARGEETEPYAADVVICAPVIAREAREQKKSAHVHHAHMVIHGMLHAQGFDHENDADATIMETLETQILRRFRIKNPYDADE